MNVYRHFFNNSKLNVFLLHNKRCFSQTSKLYSFFEPDDVGGPEYIRYKDKPLGQIFKESGKVFVEECKKLWVETKDHFQQDRKYYHHGDTDVFWRFDLKDCLKQWRISSDKTFNEGLSECSLAITDNKKAVFSGTVDLTPPKDGKKRFSGWCGIKSKKKMKAFFREDVYPFFEFTHLELRVKGDGRSYIVNLGTKRYYDVNWFSTYSCAIYTHGGPYWQVIRIPFSKFFLQSKGRIQDRQCFIPLESINCVGITCAGIAGPFRLEIDYIGAHLDRNHTEKSAYEMYKIPKDLVSY